MDGVLRRASSGEFRMAVRPVDTEDFTSELESIASRVSFGVILAALILGTAMLLSSSERISEEVLLLFDVVALIAVAAVAWLLISSFRKGKGKKRP